MVFSKTDRNMKKYLLYFLLFMAMPAGVMAQVTVSGSTGADGSYTSLTGAAPNGAFAAINATPQTGNFIVITLSGSTTESATIFLNQGLWAGLRIFPTVSGVIIGGNINNPIIPLNGADNVTIDGRVNATGGTIDMTISNTSTSLNAAAIRLINSAESNTVQYCNINASPNSGTRGIIFFASATSEDGNSYNLIENNNITGNGVNRPRNAIYSSGSAGYTNKNNIISNNKIYDFLNRGATSYGINISSANNTDWTISGNHFYETSTFVPTVNTTLYVIRISANTGNNFIISGNYIGGSAPLCGGTPWTKTGSNNNLFYAINVNVGTTDPSIIEGNTIQNFDWTNITNGSWWAIYFNGGTLDVGTGFGNTIGSDSGDESIVLTNSTSGGYFYGIANFSTGNVDINDNIFGGITTANANQANATGIYCIYKSATAGTTNIIGNTIGVEGETNNIYASSGSTGNIQHVIAINNLGTGTIEINNNIISSLTNGTTNANTGTAGEMVGISSTNGGNTITGNIIHDLKNSNANTNATTNTSVCGISLSGATLKTVTGNTIYNLSNDYDGFAGAVTGVYFAGSTGGNIISENFIHSLSVSSSSTAASLYGLRIASGTSTYSNNIISLGGDTPTTIYGIYQTGATGTTNNLWFNTVYIEGSVASGTNESYALFSTGTGNTRDFRNNILANNRSTAGGADLHYAIYIAGAGGTITCRNNDYFVSGEGTTLGYYGSPRTALPIVTGQDFGSLTSDPGFINAGSIDPEDYTPSYEYLLGVAGTGILYDYITSPRSETHPAMGAFEIPITAKIDVYNTSDVFLAAYSFLRDAFYDINQGALTGDLEVRINESITENASTVLNASGTGGANYSSILIFPTAGNIIIDGSFTLPLIDLNGADNVVIDGRENGSDSPYALTIDNKNNSTTATASAIRFINDATANTIRYCNIKGSGASATGGIIIFTTTTGSAGNDNNTIDNNRITSSAAGRPVNAIYSAGTASLLNSGNSVSNNSIFNFLSSDAATPAGIYLGTNNSEWTISGNSFYETGSFVPAASSTIYMIRIVSTTGSGFNITGNFMGGNAPSCSGTFTKTAAFDNGFFGIYLNSGTGTVNSIQANTIRSFSWSNSANATWTGIQVAGGDVNIGTVTGNNIGSTTGTGSITLNDSGNNTIYGIYITSPASAVINNNGIGSITANNNGSNASTVYGINKGATSGITTINNNTIGSTGTANSIYSTSASSAAAQSVIGIYNGGSASITINDNTIANLNNGTTNTTGGTLGEVSGISSINGTNFIERNTIYNLTNGNANTNGTNNCSVSGISLAGATTKYITGNIIYNLTNSYASFTGSVIGLYFTGGTAGNTISGNFIHSLSANTSADADIYGIRIGSGLSSYSNNIISLGGNNSSVIYGIYETGAAGNDNTILFNTLYIGGTGASLANRSYGLYSALANNIRDFRNNILVNTRTTAGGSSLHYAIWLNNASTVNLSLDYNDYFVSGTGGVLGRLGGANKTVLPIIPAGDVNSFAVNPLFVSGGSTTATDYKIGQPLTGLTAGGITTDYGAFARVNPTMGAWEAALNAWKGTTNTSWNTGTNWTVNVPLGNNINLVFDNVVTNDLVLEADRTITNFTDPQNTRQLATAGYKLTILGNLTLTGSDHINASAAGSTVEFAGTQGQSIPAGTFLNNQVYNLTVNNASNVSVSGTLNLLNNLTAISGRLDAATNSPTIIYSGSTAKTIATNLYLNDQIYNLTIANTAGVTLNNDFNITNNLTINSGALFTINAPNLLTVTGSITNSAGNSGFVIKSAGDGNDAKLINNFANVPATVELAISGGVEALDYAYHYFVPAVQSMNFDNSSVSAAATSFGLSNFAGDLLLYDETKGITVRDQGWQFFDGYDNGYGATTPFSNLSSARGYSIYTTAADKMTFTGNLNGSSHTFNLSYTGAGDDPGWNLIGNPFPSNYDLNGVDKLINTDDVDNTIYFINGDLGITYWNVLTGGTSGYSDVVAPMQGFFVIATQGTTINFPAASKTPVAALPLRSKGSGNLNYYSPKGDVKKIKLELSKGTFKDETIVCLIGDATFGYDGDYDAHKLFFDKTDFPSIYSEIGSLKYAINAVPEPEITSNTVIPLTVKIKSAGTYTINASEFQNLENVKVILKHGSAETKLSPGATYSFTTGSGTFTNFELVFVENGKKGTTGVNDVAGKQLVAWYSNSNLYINRSSELIADICDISIYDMQGRKVLAKENIGISAGNTTQVPVQLPKGMYMVHIVVNNKPFVSKIVVF